MAAIVIVVCLCSSVSVGVGAYYTRKNDTTSDVSLGPTPAPTSNPPASPSTSTPTSNPPTSTPTPAKNKNKNKKKVLTSPTPAVTTSSPFSLIDTNDDNFASIEELTSKGVPRLEQMFESFDTDKDGKLSTAELGEMLQARVPPTRLDDKRYFLVTSDNKYVVKPSARSYKFVSTGGDISEEHLKTLSKPLFVEQIHGGINNKHYIGRYKTSSGAVSDGLNIRSKHYNGRDEHMVWFGGTDRPKVILPGNNDTFNIFMAEDDAIAPNIEIRHAGQHFEHDFLSQTINIGGEATIMILISEKEQRLNIPSPFVNSLLDGKWKFITSKG